MTGSFEGTDAIGPTEFIVVGFAAHFVDAGQHRPLGGFERFDDSRGGQ